MDCDRAFARAAGGGCLYAFSTTRIFDHGFELPRLALLRGGGELGIVDARAKQGRAQSDDTEPLAMTTSPVPVPCWSL